MTLRSRVLEPPRPRLRRGRLGSALPERHLIRPVEKRLATESLGDRPCFADEWCRGGLVLDRGEVLGLIEQAWARW